VASDALTAPFAAAALVLCVAGAAKLRAPGSALRALSSIGIPAREPFVWALAAVEIALGGLALLAPGSATAIPVACMYAAFAVVALVLLRHRSECGCFGESEAPASRLQGVLNVMLMTISLAAAVGQPHGLRWIVGQPVLLLGIAGSAFGIVLAYTELPRAWSAWSAR
jgi:hypothetical protein